MADRVDDVVEVTEYVGQDATYGAMQQRAWETAEKSGFHEARATLEPWAADLWCALMLMVTELSEAAEELRDAGTKEELVRVRLTANGKPEGFVTELADVVIRIMDTMENLGVDGAGVVALKQAYNENRPFMHGRGA